MTKTTAKRPATTKSGRTVKSSRASVKAESFSEEERAAMQERARELKAGGRKGSKSVDAEPEVLAKIAELPEADRALAAQVHAAIRAAAPDLAPKLWYGMPAYARDGKVVCFFQAAGKFKTRYATLGFSDVATLDDGDVWPTAFALARWTPDVEARVAALVRRAVR